MWMRPVLGLVVALAALCQPVRPFGGQTKGEPSDSAAEAIKAARQVYDQQGPRAALPKLQALVTQFEQASDRHSEAIALGLLANCYRGLSEFRKALDYAQRGLAIKKALGDLPEEGRSYNQLGLIYWKMADYPRAHENLQHAIRIGSEAKDLKLQASALINVGLVEDEEGDYQHSSQHYDQALVLARAAGFKRGQSGALGDLGGVKMLLGRYGEAIPRYQEALKLDEDENLKPFESDDLGNLAACYSALGEIDKALTFFDRALKLAEDAGLEGEKADWHRGKGDALVRSGKYQSALKEYGEAQRVYEKAGLKRELVDTLNDCGDLHVLLGDLYSGERDFRRALDLAESIHNPHGMILNLMSMGEIERRRLRWAVAEQDFSQARSLADQAGDLASQNESLVLLARSAMDEGKWASARNQASNALRIAQKMRNPLAEAESLFTMGEVLSAERKWGSALEQYEAASKVQKTYQDPELGWRLDYGRGQALEGLGRLQNAVKEYESAVRLIETVRSELGEERYRAGYLRDRYKVYVALVDLLLRLHEPKEAFRYSEELRALSFLDQVALESPDSASGESGEQRSLCERIRQLRRAIQSEWGNSPRQRQQQALDTFSSELVEAERAYEKLLDRPTEQTGRKVAVPDVAEIQRNIDPTSALLEYVVGPSQLDVLVITHQQIRATTVAVGQQQLQSRIELLRYLIHSPGTTAWRRPAASLRHLLIDPVESEGWLQGVDELYIAPDDVLNYLPFAALPRSAGPDGRFLIEDYVLAHVPTAAALLPQAQDPPGTSVLAVAPENTRLRWAQTEARDVAGFFPGEARLLTGNRATETSFKQLAGQYDVLHLATHGQLNRYAPLLSALELEPDNENDGWLDVYEILQLRLRARLVTLSGCNTALGSGYFSQIPAGDEFVGLTRAFLSAGAHSVVASLWEVNDRSTLDFMQRFYRDRENADDAGALAQAQREFLRGGGRYRQPYYWAPFVLVGN
jgi:CHAT domain-containing protein/Tfp pilus assembly protein PilF